MKNILNSLNNVLNTANRTASAVNRTKSTAKTVIGAGKDKKDKQKELVWKCACGKKNSAKFCANCGKPKPACPQCGIDIKGEKFCPECGTAIS